MYLVDTTDGSESIIQWASRRQTSMATSAPEAEVTAMAEGFATAIFLFDSLKEIQVITGFGPDCILSMKTDSAVALKQMNTHTVTVRTRTAAQKLAFLRELIYQDPQIQPIYIPGPSQRADSQTKCLSGPALRKAQDYLNLRHVVTPVVSTIRVLGVDRSGADSSACERRKECEGRQERPGRDTSHVRSVSPCLSSREGLGQEQDQEGMQASSRQILCGVDPRNAPFLCRLRMDCSNQDQDSIFLQEYRRIVTVIRQEDIVVDVHDKRSPMPFMCGSSHMPRKEEGSAHKRTKPQTPTPKGDVSLADERVKADRETQRRERGQAKQRALQHASAPAKASMRDPGTESESTVVRKRPARTEDETPTVSESSALPATPAESEISQSATTTNPQQAPTADESQPLPTNPQRVDRQVEEITPTLSRESSSVKKRVVKKGSAAIAEQGAITELRSRDTSASSIGDPKSVPKAGSAPRPPSSPKATSAPKSVPSPKAMTPKATEPKGVVPVMASPIAPSPKAVAPKVASPKTPIAKNTPLPKTTSVPKALSPSGAQTPPKAIVVPKETVPKKRTQWSEIEDDTEHPSESVPKAKPRSEEPPKTKAKSEVSSKAKSASDEPPKAKAKSEGPPKAKARSEGPPKAKPKSEPEVSPKTTVKPTPAPSTRHPAAATVAVKSSSST